MADGTRGQTGERQRTEASGGHQRGEEAGAKSLSCLDPWEVVLRRPTLSGRGGGERGREGLGDGHGSSRRRAEGS
ncbi:hypothetical protein E2562_034946 [Oryza meyeriana var. granulata]|uniref:Uncharacterized protein n=1 Tax=Oryza meyeriana var. granulata TaxID=110450 RepID=A0A6G1DA64_9ORYZ|nr:hypothetical protein E2562_034946 [Oryza meyeriana var. granulata]